MENAREQREKAGSAGTLPKNCQSGQGKENKRWGEGKGITSSAVGEVEASRDEPLGQVEEEPAGREKQRVWTRQERGPLASPAWAEARPGPECASRDPNHRIKTQAEQASREEGRGVLEPLSWVEEDAAGVSRGEGEKVYGSRVAESRPEEADEGEDEAHTECRPCEGATRGQVGMRAQLLAMPLRQNSAREAQESFWPTSRRPRQQPARKGNDAGLLCENGARTKTRPRASSELSCRAWAAIRSSSRQDVGETQPRRASGLRGEGRAHTHARGARKAKARPRTQPL